MYLVRIYFHGPQTNWMGKVSQMEVILERPCPWLWLAKSLAHSYLKDLNKGRCGSVITEGDTVIEQHQARLALEA